MIEAVTRLRETELVSKVKIEHIRVEYCYEDDATGQNLETLVGVSWLYETRDETLYPMVKSKRRGGIWNSKVWTFPDPATAQEVFDAITIKHPDWPIVGNPLKPFMPLAGHRFSRIALSNGLEGCLMPLPAPYFSEIISTPAAFKITAANGSKDKQEIGFFIGSTAEITATTNSLVNQGAICDDSYSKAWPFMAGHSKLKVKVNGWAVQVLCDPSNPLHYRVIPWSGTGQINTTRKLWPELKIKIQSLGLEYEGDDPEAELAVPSIFDSSRVSGWDAPAPNGYLLHAYQKLGAEFCAKRGMRALIGDEMGVGKTVQAIAAADAVNAPRILVICPASARYVWDREIQGWGGRGGIQHITNQLDTLDHACRWHIVTYDIVTTRAETWRLNDLGEEDAFLAAYPKLKQHIKQKPGSAYPRKVSFDKFLGASPAFADPKRKQSWDKVMIRLRGELIEQFLACDHLLTILDEAHRVKNRASKRTKVIQRIAESEKQILMLTGTPLRNNEHEAAVLLGVLDAGAAAALDKKKGYSVRDVQDYLEHLMIRRTKAQVLPELPDKTRQRIDINELDASQMQIYQDALDYAHECYSKAIQSGATHAEAKQKMLGGIEQARIALGVAKVAGGSAIELIVEVVENNVERCCVVFCSHRQVSDSLLAQVQKENLRAAVVDGRTSQKERALLVDDFQNGRLDVFIGGINSAGEAITLTRADTVIFVELDWVPAAIQQAEDRIHRVGQRRNCQVIQLIAKMHESDENNLDVMMAQVLNSKHAQIGVVLNEGAFNIISDEGESMKGKIIDRLLGVSNVAAPKTHSKAADTPIPW